MHTAKQLINETPQPPRNERARPILKWAGGKSQLVPTLLSEIPSKYGRYVEPFFGGGALFFSLAPGRALIADRNGELVNLYKVVRDSASRLEGALARMKNSEEEFYRIRGLDWEILDPVDAAARTIFLNKTCYNGLYRVNRKGQFNTPFGRYSNPTILDSQNLALASRALSSATIVQGDYLEVLKGHAVPGDLIFLDPPYLPVSKYSDFKRYTKEQFSEDDHIALAQEVERLSELGCYVLLTNSNHPLVHRLYGHHRLEVCATKRSISSNASTRTGEDVLVVVEPKRRKRIKIVREELSPQVDQYPSTRYMGSKRKLLASIWGVASQFTHNTVLDLFSGSGVVSYMFKAQGKKVVSNDHMASAYANAAAMVANSSVSVSRDEAESMLKPRDKADSFVLDTFEGIYFTPGELRTIDAVRSHINATRNPHKKAILRAALVRACMKRQPRGIFTYTGHRYDDGRADLRKTVGEHFVEAVQAVSSAVFDNGSVCEARYGDALEMSASDIDLVYMDPPYYSQHSDNEYVRRYHFVEGLARDWKGVEIQEHTATKKFKSYPTPFSTHQGAVDAFDRLFRKFRHSTIVVSYSSNSLPEKDEMVALLARNKSRVEVVPVEHTYSFGNRASAKEPIRNRVQEYIFVGY